MCREACVFIPSQKAISEHRRDGNAFVLKEEALLGRRIKFPVWSVAPSRGFSLTEMVVTVAVMLVLAAIAIPSLTRVFAIYQLNDCASRVAGILKFTRYEAIRVNKQVSARTMATGANWTVFADTNGNGIADPTETQDVVIPPLGLVPAAGLPDPSPIANSLGNAGLVLTVLSGVNASVAFDSRGAVLSGNGTNVYVLYVGNLADSTVGYRAVVLLPSGMVQIWSSSTGTWQQVS